MIFGNGCAAEHTTRIGQRSPRKGNLIKDENR